MVIIVKCFNIPMYLSFHMILWQQATTLMFITLFTLGLERLVFEVS